jgi:hypothetical protein
LLMVIDLEKPQINADQRRYLSNLEANECNSS